MHVLLYEVQELCHEMNHLMHLNIPNMLNLIFEAVLYQDIDSHKILIRIYLFAFVLARALVFLTSPTRQLHAYT